MTISIAANAPEDLKKIHEIVCPQCDRLTQHAVLASVAVTEENPEVEVWSEYEVVSCRGCQHMSFRSNWSASDEFQYDEQNELSPVEHPEYFPPRRAGRKMVRKAYYLPPKIRAIYFEVHQAIAAGHRVLASIGIRALVEAVCAEKGAKGRTLEKRIDALASQNTLTVEGASVLHKTRLLGNRAAHQVDPPDEHQLDVAMDIAEQLLVNVWILPQVAKSLNL